MASFPRFYSFVVKNGLLAQSPPLKTTLIMFWWSVCTLPGCLHLHLLQHKTLAVKWLADNLFFFSIINNRLNVLPDKLASGRFLLSFLGKKLQYTYKWSSTIVICMCISDWWRWNVFQERPRHPLNQYTMIQDILLCHFIMFWTLKYSRCVSLLLDI